MSLSQFLRRFAAPMLSSAVVATILHATAHASGYAFTSVAQTGTSLSSIINQSPEINDAGAVLFRGTDQSGVEHGYLAHGGMVEQAFNGTGFGSFSLSGAAQLNDHNDVVFFGRRTATSLFLARGGNWSELYDGNSTINAPNGDPAINDAGQIAFLATFADRASVLVGDVQGSPLRVVAMEGAISLSTASPQISQSGDVAYVSRAPDTSLRTLHVAQSDNSTRDVYTTADSSEVLAPNRWLTEAELLYSRRLGTSLSWWLDSAGVSTAVAPVLDLPGRIVDLDMNASRHTAALVSETSGGTSVFAGDEVTMSRLLGLWDNVNGRRVAQVHFNTGGLNDAEQIAMWVRTYDPATGRDYRTDIVVATPREDTAPTPTVFAATDFMEPPLGASSYVPGEDGRELGFTTVMAPSGGQNPFAGVGNIEGGPERYLAHRSVVATTTFDAVNLGGWQDPSISMVVHRGDTTYEADDFLRVSATNGSDTVTLFEQHGGPSSGDFNNFDPLVYLTWPVPIGWEQATLIISSSSNSSGGTEWYEFRQITFEGTVAVPEPSAWAILGVAAVAVVFGLSWPTLLLSRATHEQDSLGT